jgi:aryl-alcohol dehydrogenase-like predicted oxidoreductase
MTFGREADEAVSASIFDRCVQSGINFFDTANIYAGGESERLLGRLLKGRRDQFILSSKVGMQAGAGPNDAGLSRRHILMQLEASLQRLQTEWLDIYFCHCEDATTPTQETLRALDDVVRQGKVRYLGISNWPAWKIASARGIASQWGISSPAVIQPMYSLVKRTAEIELLPMAQEEGLGVVTYSPLGGGLLTGKYRTGESRGRLVDNNLYARRYGEPSTHEIAARFCDHAQQRGVDAATLAVAWVMNHPAITAPIIGARNLQQLEPSLGAAELVLSQEWREQISALTPLVPLATDRSENSVKLS